jgi:hypothetical protein
MPGILGMKRSVPSEIDKPLPSKRPNPVIAVNKLGSELNEANDIQLVPQRSGLESTTAARTASRLDNSDEDDDLFSDDEEFVPAKSCIRLDNSDEDDDLDLTEMEGESPFLPTVRRRFAQLRTQHRKGQFMSTNNTPSGEYIRDFNITGHFWRLTGSGHVRRKWLSRHESETSYDGRKTYCPQLGDSIVYIPRAHFETIDKFPSFTPPWQRWPQGTVWPVVRCSIRGIRYRFPREDYFRGGQ